MIGDKFQCSYANSTDIECKC